jgi:hypothetical protein
MSTYFSKLGKKGFLCLGEVFFVSGAYPAGRRHAQGKEVDKFSALGDPEIKMGAGRQPGRTDMPYDLALPYFCPGTNTFPEP